MSELLETTVGMYLLAAGVVLAAIFVGSVLGETLRKRVLRRWPGLESADDDLRIWPQEWEPGWDTTGWQDIMEKGGVIVIDETNHGPRPGETYVEFQERLKAEYGLDPITAYGLANHLMMFGTHDTPSDFDRKVITAFSPSYEGTRGMPEDLELKATRAKRWAEDNEVPYINVPLNRIN